MEQLIELLKQIQDLSGVAIDALEGAAGDTKGKPEGEPKPGGPEGGRPGEGKPEGGPKPGGDMKPEGGEAPPEKEEGGRY